MNDKRLLFYAVLSLRPRTFVASSFLGDAQNGDNAARQAGTALTENDFVKDSLLFSVADAGVVAVDVR